MRSRLGPSSTTGGPSTAASDEPFSLIAPLVDAFAPDDFRRAEEAGVTDILTMPWAFYAGLDAPLDQKIDGLARYYEDVVAPVNNL